MILKASQRKKFFKNWMLPTLLLGTLLLLVFYKFSSNAYRTVENSEFVKETYTCGAETVDEKSFIENDMKFGGGQTQSTEQARTGKFSSKLDGENQYGINLKLTNLVAGRTYKAQVWQFTKTDTKGLIVASAANSEDYYVSSQRTVETDSSWWEKIELVFTVPTSKKVSALSVYLYTQDQSGEVYFDDFKVTSIQSIDDFSPNDFQAKRFYMQIDKAGEERIEAIKKGAFKKGILQTTEDSWIKSKVTTSSGIEKAKIRLKGDWLDHLFRGQSSFRIQLKSKNSWQGMQTFSVQSPSTRSFLREWVYHQFLEYADVLTPRYDFINFHYNEKEPLVYAFEEHFTKNLVENKLRREGPIIKLTEDRLWEGVGRSLQQSRRFPDGHNKETALWSSETKPFKEGKTGKNPTLAASFEIAQNLMHQYKYGLKPASEIFDTERLAKYMAITDILQADHSLTWHNQRFYYNPATSLLEPIGFDGYGENSLDEPYAKLYIEKVYTERHEISEPIHRIFSDEVFVEEYLKYLKEYSSPDFIQKFLAQIEEPLAKREKFIKRDYNSYSYNRESILRRAIKIQEKIIPFSASLQVFRKATDGDEMELEIKNVHILPLEVIHIGKSQLPTNKRTSHFVFPNQLGEIPVYKTLKAPSWATTVHYRLSGLDSIFQVSIPKWTSPNDWSPRGEMLAEIEKTKKQKVYTEENNLIIFDKKEYSINFPLVIEKGKRVMIAPDTHFKFSNGGFFFSYSPVEMRGDEDEPITVEATDGNSGAFVVMQAKGKSFLRHVQFINQNTLKYNGWNLSGAVTFYESDVEVLACSFIDNNCEDALNIVRSEFTVNESAFQNIYADAFDADFCEGKVTNCGFKEIGNDALDFSTCTISIDNCKMLNIGDKGISAGEHATITAKNIEIDNANIGFASKDLSILTLDNVTVKNSSKGFTAYQKKPEYGAATINLKQHTIQNVKYPFMIEGSSVLNKE